MRGTAISLHTCRIGQRITPACAGNSQALNTLSPLLEDHPRVCEEQRIHSPAVAVLVGSPPRVRGTVVHGGLGDVDDGITPACAGNSIRPLHGPPGGSDHPRVCGEQPCCMTRQMRLHGSPPRVRGTGPFCGEQEKLSRITPACAGNRFGGASWNAVRHHHPRVCGEQVSIFPFPVACIGSPPRVRGTVGDVDDVDGGVGITPACAGNSKEENI